MGLAMPYEQHDNPSDRMQLVGIMQAAELHAMNE